MKKIIDCLFIGHNEIDFARYEGIVRGMGTGSGAYKDLNLNFIRYNNELYTVMDIFNLFNYNTTSPGSFNKPLSSGETFSNAIAYLGTYLNRRGYIFAYVNSFQDDKEELARILEEETVLTIAIITTLYVSFLPIVEIVDFIKTRNTTAKIIVGGPYISTQVRLQDPASLEYLLSTTIGADIYVNSSQGEATLCKIIHALKHHLPLDKINNIYYKTERGYLSTPILPENNQLSANMVNWSLFPGKVSAVTNVRTSISCPFSCAFCGFPQHAGRFQAVEAETVIQELKQLDRQNLVKIIDFIDDTFNVPQKRFKEILSLMINNRFNFGWISNLRPQYVDKEMVQLMKESGCQGVFLGIESGNNQILKNMNKAASVENYLEGIALLKKYEIPTMGSFIIGFPGETHETIQDTLQFIRGSEMDFFRAQLWYCEPITPIWKEKDRYNLSGESFEWSHKTMESQTAAQWVDEIFFTFEKSVWVPQYQFGFDGIWKLILRGMSLNQVKDFLKAFNRGIKQKLIDPSKQEIRIDIIKQIKESLRQDNDLDQPVLKKKDDIALDVGFVQFNF
jgi:anaerobic magnesium-protoporphyrin IX monomethyl ester cyclase